MEYMAAALILFVAFLHLIFLVLEMSLWQTHLGLKTFGMTPVAADHTAVLAKNMGLYNGFLAAGLIWSFFISDPYYQAAFRTFFLLFIIIAGVYGAYTAKKSILYTQGFPAALALFVMWMA